MSHAYVVRVLPLQHELDIELTLTGATGEVLVQTPTWVPGAYGLMKYGRDLVDVRATDSTGRTLPIRREAWSGYRIGEANGTIQVRFRAYGFDPAWGELSGLVDHTYAVLLATRYLFAPGLPGPVRVRYELPTGWRLHHPAGAKSITATEFEYPGFARLLDTPVVCGAFDLRTRDVEGTPFHHVFVDRALGFETEVEGFIDELVEVAKETKHVFGGFPFESYTWVFSFNPTAHWGLEHANSTMIGLGEHSLIDPALRARAIRVSAHELVHAWNVCRMKPEALAKPDHVVAPVIDSMWVAEGLTRYYEFLLSVRSGAIAPGEFWSNVVNYHQHLEAMPAFGRVSALDSSRTTFLNHNKYPGSINNTVDYYDVGMLIAFDLDAHLRLQGDAGLDADFRALFDQFGANPNGYRHADVLAVLGAKPGAADLLRREVEQAGKLSTLEQLAKLGFEVKREEVAYVGLILKENSAAELTNVLDDSPAGSTGIAPGDELQQVGGFPYSFKALTWLIRQAQPFTVRVKRGHTEHTFTLAPSKRSRVSGLSWNGTADQLDRWRTWLNQPDLALQPGEAISLSSFENFHGIQTVL